MENYEPKKLLILRILEILQSFSDSDHKLRQGDIIALLRVHYGMECERKAVARNIEFLQQAGYDIVNDGAGVYLADRKFEAGELRLLIDSVLTNRNICKAYTKELIGKLTEEGGKYFKNYAKHVVNLDDWQKDESYDFFYNIEILCEAIEKKVKVEFFYNSYGLDKKLHNRRDKKTLVNPYQLFLKNGHYYLACNYEGYENILYCRVDKITELCLTELKQKPLTAIQGYENGLNLGKINTRLPYMFEDVPQRIEFVTANGAENMIDNVLDWFGRDVQIKECKDGAYKFTVLAGLRAMRFWILQFGKYVKVLSPQSLVEQIKSDIDEIKKLYEAL